MEEVFIKDRERRRILWHNVHVPQQIINRKLFSSLEEGLERLRKAIRKTGILIHSLKDEECLYVFRSDIGKMVVCLIVLKIKGLFYIPTIYEAEEGHVRDYKSILRKRKLNK